MAILVAIGHYFWWLKNPSVPLSFILAVDYFFILSGFVLSNSISHKQEFNAIEFAKSRFLRLYPIYIFSVSASLILHAFVGDLHKTPHLPDIIEILSIGQMLPFNRITNYMLIEPMGISWSISAELWVGIILFPVVVFLKKNTNLLLFPFLILSILITFFLLSTYSPDFMNVHYVRLTPLITFGVLRAYLGYCLGIFIFIIYQYNKVDSKYLLNEKLISIIQLLLIAIIIFIYAKKNYYRNNEYYSVFLFALLIYFLSLSKGMIFIITNNGLGKWLGKLSYPLYLIHPFFITLNTVLFKDLFSLLSICTYLCLSIVSSIILHVFIENKFMLFFKKLKT